MTTTQASDAPDSTKPRLSDPDANLAGTTLYVTGLPPDTKESELNRVFAPFGKIKSGKVVCDPHTGLSLGYGFVEYSNGEHARQAMQALDRTPFMGVLITVRKAKRTRPHSPTPGTYRGKKNVKVQSGSDGEGRPVPHPPHPTYGPGHPPPPPPPHARRSYSPPPHPGFRGDYDYAWGGMPPKLPPPPPGHRGDPYVDRYGSPPIERDYPRRPPPPHEYYPPGRPEISERYERSHRYEPYARMPMHAEWERDRLRERGRDYDRPPHRRSHSPGEGHRRDRSPPPTPPGPEHGWGYEGRERRWDDRDYRDVYASQPEPYPPRHRGYSPRGGPPPPPGPPPSRRDRDWRY